VLEFRGALTSNPHFAEACIPQSVRERGSTLLEDFGSVRDEEKAGTG
jgi:hypothetical protein